MSQEKEEIRARTVSCCTALLWKVLEFAYKVMQFERLMPDKTCKQLVLARVIEPGAKQNVIRILDKLGLETPDKEDVLSALCRCIEHDYHLTDIAGAGASYASITGGLTLGFIDAATLYFDAEKDDDGWDYDDWDDDDDEWDDDEDEDDDWDDDDDCAENQEDGTNNSAEEQINLNGNRDELWKTLLQMRAEYQKERRAQLAKERQKDPKFRVNLLKNRDGIPIGMNFFPGTTPEIEDFLEIRRDYQELYLMENLVVVGDESKITPVMLEQLDAAGLYFIVGSRIQKAPHELETNFRAGKGPYREGQIIDTITPRNATEDTKRTSVRRHPKWKESMSDSWRAVWVYSETRAGRDRRTLRQQQSRALAAVESGVSARLPRFVIRDESGLRFDEAAFVRAENLVGWKGYVTNAPVGLVSSEKIASAYHDLWNTEQYLRMSRSDLKYDWGSENQRQEVEAHLMIAVAALGVCRFLEDRTQVPTRGLIRMLAQIWQTTGELPNGERVVASTRISPEVRKILKRLSVEPANRDLGGGPAGES